MARPGQKRQKLVIPVVNKATKIAAARNESGPTRKMRMISLAISGTSNGVTAPIRETRNQVSQAHEDSEQHRELETNGQMIRIPGFIHWAKWE